MRVGSLKKFTEDAPKWQQSSDTWTDNQEDTKKTHRDVFGVINMIISVESTSGGKKKRLRKDICMGVMWVRMYTLASIAKYRISKGSNIGNNEEIKH